MITIKPKTMIQPNELRLLNWVKYDNRYFQIHSIAYVFPTLNTDEFGIGVVDYNNIQPIELTPDILEAAGFYWSIYHQAYHFGDPLCNDFYDLNECYPKGFQLSTFKKSTLIGQPFFYLHQLQNLYYFLTGEELQIDLTKLNKEK